MQALLVTLLWSASWVLIKIGLAEELPALTFGGLRYVLAFIVLLPLLLRPATRRSLAGLGRRDWGWLVLLGVIFYTLTQGAQFAALAYLPAVMLSLMLNFTTVVVALMGIALLREIPGRAQWFGIVLFLLGVGLYFSQSSLEGATLLGLLIGLLCMLSNSAGSVLGRAVNRSASIPSSVVTVVSMGVGSLLLLAAGLLLEGLPSLTPTTWAIVIWLAVVHTAFTFTLWNHTLRTLPAVESSILNNTMLFQIALLAWVFLGEAISPVEGVGLVVAAVGVLIVQLRAGKAA